MLDSDITWRALIEAVDYLRLGHAPRPNIVYKKAVGVWRERQHGRRDEAGDPRGAPQAVDPLIVDATVADGYGGLDDRESRSLEARNWMRAELDAAAAAVEFSLSSGNSTAVFPIAAYGARLGADLGADHLLAAVNCLITLTCSVTLRAGAAELHARHPPAREFTVHDCTAPARWGKGELGRQMRHSSLAAVAYAGWVTLGECELDTAPDHLRAELYDVMGCLWRFTGVALIAGTVALLERYQFSAQTRRHASEQRTKAWLERTLAALELIGSVHTEIGVVKIDSSTRDDLANQIVQILTTLDDFGSQGHNGAVCPGARLARRGSR